MKPIQVNNYSSTVDALPDIASVKNSKSSTFRLQNGKARDMSAQPRRIVYEGVEMLSMK